MTRNQCVACAFGGLLAVVAVCFWFWGQGNKTERLTLSVPATQSVAAIVPRDNSVLQAIYRPRHFVPLWFGTDDQLTQDGRAVGALLSHAGEQGLPPARYSVPPLPVHASQVDRARFDVAMTQAAIAYSHDMRYGLLTPQKLFPDVSLPAAHDDVVAALTAAVTQGEGAAYMRQLEPPGGMYSRLKTALARYRAAPDQSWPQISSADDTANLIQRLRLEGWIGAALPSGTDLTDAVRRYQTATGLDVTGKLDDKTLAALNISPSHRADQIAVNMERWRWVPRNLGRQYIMVNVPAASLVLIENETAALVSRVVVGAPDKPTPILVAHAVAVTINPVWHVPKSIVDKEIKPKMAENPNYLDDKGMVEKDGDITQPPGPTNALGVAKFEMPNEFDVYLHDTPAKHAFYSDERALSHGCVRVEQIRPLVGHLLGLSDDELGQLVQTGQTQREPLRIPIPVLIQYWTAIPWQNGIAFRSDVYGRDAVMIAALHGDALPEKLAAR